MFHLGLIGDAVETYKWEIVDTYPWDVLVRYHWDVSGCFIWDWFETSWKRTDGTSLLRPLGTWSQRSNETSWRHTTETSLYFPLRCRWVFCLRRTCDVVGTYRETSLRRCHGVLLPDGNWIYLLRNCFSNYVYLKDIYITLNCKNVVFIGVRNFANL